MLPDDLQAPPNKAFEQTGPQGLLCGKGLRSGGSQPRLEALRESTHTRQEVFHNGHPADLQHQ